MLQASILRKLLLPHIPSASGVEIVNHQLFLIGDDSPVLYILDMDGVLKQHVLLFDTDQFSAGRIAKNTKPDFEAITVMVIDGKPMLFIAGSGSLSPQRDGGYLVEVDNNYAVAKISLAGLYAHLRQMPEVTGVGKLNIEGAAADEKYVYLLQRGNVTGHNTLIRYDLHAFYSYISGTSGQLPLPIVYVYTLPQIMGIQSGFSGVCIIPGKDALLVTASVENTANEIDDGEVLGSFLALLYPADGMEGNISYVPVTENNQLFIGKIESVAVQELLPDGRMKAIAVTDCDKGYSELLFVEIFT